METEKKFISYIEYAKILRHCGATKNEIAEILKRLIETIGENKELDIPMAEIALKLWRNKGIDFMDIIMHFDKENMMLTKKTEIT